jgi:hypothetical protein
VRRRTIVFFVWLAVCTALTGALVWDFLSTARCLDVDGWTMCYGGPWQDDDLTDPVTIPEVAFVFACLGIGFPTMALGIGTGGYYLVRAIRRRPDASRILGKD